MNFSKNIGQNSSLFTLIIIAVAIVMGTSSGEAQMLNSRKQGTVAEQLEQNSRQREGLVQEILNYAYKYRGTPYRHGAMSPRAFDCSGFTSYVFKQFGITLDRRSSAQIYDGRCVARKDLQPGDVLCFYSSGDYIGHAGIYIGNNQFVHAANSRSGVIITDLSGYYSSRGYEARRIVS